VQRNGLPAGGGFGSCVGGFGLVGGRDKNGRSFIFDAWL